MHLASISDNLWNIDFGTKSLIATILRHLLQLYLDYLAPYVMYVSNFYSTPLTIFNNQSTGPVFLTIYGILILVQSL